MPGLFLLVRLADQPGVHRQTGLTQQLGDAVGRDPVDIEGQFVPVCIFQVPKPVTGLEADQQIATWS